MNIKLTKNIYYEVGSCEVSGVVTIVWASATPPPTNIDNIYNMNFWMA